MNLVDIAKDLYRNAVDQRNVEYLSSFLADQVRFRIGNHNPVEGKAEVLEANRAFFGSISAMSHTIEGLWQQENHLICHGNVHYRRLDGSKHTAAFATILTFSGDKITDYRVYADLSGL